MGEVYRARDAKLGREVAIKVLPGQFSKDRERLARFEREARLLASLNHPNIATLHGFEESNDIRFLVMELVEGETLGERLARGPIPLDEALPLFEQIASGLHAAHEKGVIHRDLKPANIKITPDGVPKILDFGLAKAALAGEVSEESPTVTRQGTEAGIILGTAAYMSPEQARGKSLDKRTDVWSFGCVFYEALTGRTVFLGETVSDTIAKILEREPDWRTLPTRTPVLVRSLLRRCLAKDPARRCLGAQLAISVHNCPVLADTRFPMSIFKRTQRKYVKKAYRVRNCREYEAGLRETTFHRYKAIVGSAMRARGLAAQRVEARIGCKILNTMTALGMPDSEMIG